MLCIFVILVYSLLHNDTFLGWLTYKNVYKKIFKVIYKYIFFEGDATINLYFVKASFESNVRKIKEGLSMLCFNFVVVYSVFLTNFIYIYSSWCFFCFILATLYFFFNI